ncbi:MAG: hypothetical protein U9Q67_02590 [Patescibacteria group bacterium]|nr:hypothetical protein [Patescibacteria group bacterium]
MKKKCSNTVLVNILAIALLALVLAQPAFAVNECIIVGISSDPVVLGAPPNGTATVPIILHNVTDFGAGTLRVTYNSSVCNVANVKTGTPAIVLGSHNTPGLVRISAVSPEDGQTGDVIFANLKIRAIGRCGETSPLNVTVDLLATYAGEKISATNINVSNGIFTILAVLNPYVSNPSATPGTILNDNGRPRIPGTNKSQLNVTVTDDTEVVSVTIDLSPIGGSNKTQMNKIPGTDIWTVTTNAVEGINLTHNLIVTATNSSGNSNTAVSIQLTVLRRGDVDHDNDVDEEDASAIQEYINGNASDPGVFSGDVYPATGDNAVNIWDATYIWYSSSGYVDEP